MVADVMLKTPSFKFFRLKQIIVYLFKMSAAFHNKSHGGKPTNSGKYIISDDEFFSKMMLSRSDDFLPPSYPLCNSKSPVPLQNALFWVQIGFTGVCVSLQKPGSVVWRYFFPEHLILIFFRLKVKLKVDLLKLTLTLVFPHNYFQILRQNSKSFYLENIKVRPRDDFSTACLPG
jgi:hypothetical protein